LHDGSCMGRAGVAAPGCDKNPRPRGKAPSEQRRSGLDHGSQVSPVSQLMWRKETWSGRMLSTPNVIGS
jgi:hypothetical protein